MKLNICVWKMNNYLEVNRSTQVRNQAQYLFQTILYNDSGRDVQRDIKKRYWSWQINE